MPKKAARVRSRARSRARSMPRRRRGRGGRGSIVPHEMGSVIAGGGVALLGGLAISRFFTGLPKWLSPAGVALWMYGWWRGIAIFRWAGLLFIALAVAEWLGISTGLMNGVNNAMARLNIGGGGATTPGETTPGARSEASPNVQKAAADLTAISNAYTAARNAYAA